jgi:hypothetical protein
VITSFSFEHSIADVGIQDGDLLRFYPATSAGGDIFGNIHDLVTGLVTGGGIGAFAFQLIRMWLDERKSRRVSIKYEGLEVSFSGGISTETIETNMKQFIDLKDDLERKKIQIGVTDSIGDLAEEDTHRSTRPTRKSGHKS